MLPPPNLSHAAGSVDARLKPAVDVIGLTAFSEEHGQVADVLTLTGRTLGGELHESSTSLLLTAGCHEPIKANRSHKLNILAIGYDGSFTAETRYAQAMTKDPDKEHPDHPEHPHGTPPGQTPEHDPPGHETDPDAPHPEHPIADTDVPTINPL